VDPAGGDFRPASASPLVDAGVVLPGINDDYSGAAPDIGAFEVTAASIAIGDVAVAEGATDAVFTVTLSRASAQTVSVSWATANGTAVSGSDYAAGSGVLSFSPGVTSRALGVAVLGDSLDEPDESFLVNLSGASNATILDDQGEGIILDDDPTPLLSIDDVSVSEGDGGSSDAVFTVSLTSASAGVGASLYDCGQHGAGGQRLHLAIGDGELRLGIDGATDGGGSRPGGRAGRADRALCGRPVRACQRAPG
jgi:hypothetical protein